MFLLFICHILPSFSSLLLICIHTVYSGWDSVSSVSSCIICTAQWVETKDKSERKTITSVLLKYRWAVQHWTAGRTTCRLFCNTNTISCPRRESWARSEIVPPFFNGTSLSAAACWEFYNWSDVLRAFRNDRDYSFMLLKVIHQYEPQSADEATGQKSLTKEN